MTNPPFLMTAAVSIKKLGSVVLMIFIKTDKFYHSEYFFWVNWRLTNYSTYCIMIVYEYPNGVSD